MGNYEIIFMNITLPAKMVIVKGAKFSSSLTVTRWQDACSCSHLDKYLAQPYI